MPYLTISFERMRIRMSLGSFETPVLYAIQLEDEKNKYQCSMTGKGVRSSCNS